MKKYLLMIAILLISHEAFSKDGNVKYGIKIGSNISNISKLKASAYDVTIDMLQNDGPAFGFHAGGFVNITFNKYLGLQPELLFSMQGGKQRYSSDVLDGQPVNSILNTTSSYRFNYIHLPVLLEIKPVENLGLLVGPQFGFNVYKSETFRGHTTKGKNWDSDYKKNFGKNPFNSFDLALALGAQYTFIDHLDVGIRYNIGLTNSFSSDLFNDAGTWTKADISGWKNRVFQLSVGWRF